MCGSATWVPGARLQALEAVAVPRARSQVGAVWLVLLVLLLLTAVVEVVVAVLESLQRPLFLFLLVEMMKALVEAEEAWLFLFPFLVEALFPEQGRLEPRPG